MSFFSNEKCTGSLSDAMIMSQPLTKSLTDAYIPEVWYFVISGKTVICRIVEPYNCIDLTVHNSSSIKKIAHNIAMKCGVDRKFLKSTSKSMPLKQFSYTITGYTLYNDCLYLTITSQFVNRVLKCIPTHHRSHLSSSSKKHLDLISICRPLILAGIPKIPYE